MDLRRKINHRTVAKKDVTKGGSLEHGLIPLRSLSSDSAEESNIECDLWLKDGRQHPEVFTGPRRVEQALSKRTCEKAQLLKQDNHREFEVVNQARNFE